MLALAMYRSKVGPCGHYLPESTAKANEYGWVVQAARCHACTAVAGEAERYKDNPHSHAILYGVNRG